MIYLSLKARTYRDIDGAGGVALDPAVHDAGDPGVGHPDTGHGQVRHVQHRGPTDQIVPPPAVRILRQESANWGSKFKFLNL